MTHAIPVEEADRLLNELEELARSAISSVDFCQQFLDRLRFIVNSQSVAILSMVQPDQWIVLGQTGDTSADAKEEFQKCIVQDPQAEYWMGIKGSPNWYATALRSGDTLQSAILLTFSGQLSAASIPALKELTAAFGEILAMHQLKHLESVFNRHWTQFYRLNHQLSACKSASDTSIGLVNNLIPILSAARVSLATLGGPLSITSLKLVAVSGVDNLDRNSLVVKNLEQVAHQALTQNEPIVRRTTMVRTNAAEPAPATSNQDGLFPNLMAMRFYFDERQASNQRSAIVLEWSTHQAMLDATSAITHFLPNLCTTWQQQQRWFGIPRWIRDLATWGQRLPISRYSYRWLKAALFLGLLLASGWLLFKPYPLTIEAEAVLEPISRRAVHASVDGFIEALLVEAGQVVHKNQVLARLRSPVLDLQIEETLGQIRAFAEKRNGLRVAVNQLSSSTSDSQATQTRLSADILLLETQERLSQAKLDFFMQEKGKLTIESPIEGVVVSRDLERDLEFRPLKRGDALFNVADLNGDWQLDIRVADRDSGYVLKHYNQTDRPVTFVLNSIPEEQFSATLRHISTVMEYRAGEVSFLPVVADIEKAVAKRAHVGAPARVFFHCGYQPTWFVWCRPLVEAIQKRVWLFYDDKPASSEDS